MMRLSGYGSLFRYHMIIGVLNRSRSLALELEGNGKPLYRNRCEINVAKQFEVGKYQDTWFLKDDITSILKIQCTPNSLLSKVIFENTKQFKNPDGGRLKIVEKSGKPIFAGLKSVPKTNNVTCVFGSFDCPVSGKIQCDISRIIYEVTCLTCYKPCTYIHLENPMHSKQFAVKSNF